MHAALYPTRISHRRLFPKPYRFVYRVFYLLVDIDHIDDTARRLRLFSHNRFNLLSLHDRDHGHCEIGGLRRWAEGVLRERGIELDGGRIRLLSLPRVFGYSFNPISMWYCEHADGSLRAVIAEVKNTFGETHSYLLASDGAAMPYQQVHEKEKDFHVSPLMDMEGRYRFEFNDPGERSRVVIREYRREELLLVATMAGERRPLTDTSILKQVLGMPLMALKVVVGIYWEALKIWLHGTRFHTKPPPPGHEVS